MPAAAVDIILRASPYCTESKAFFARLATQPSVARKLLYDTMIRALVSANLWAKLDALYLFAAADSPTALTSLISAVYNATAINSPTFTADQGFTGASTKYIDTNFNPSTAGGLYLLDSASAFAWSLTTGQIAGPIFGTVTGSSAIIYSRYTDDKSYFRINATAGAANMAPASLDGLGLWSMSRTAASASVSYRDGSQLTTNGAASAAVPTVNLAFLIGDAAASGAHLVGVGGFGGQLSATEHLALYNALHTYMQAVAGVA